jgi:hypothetical protein
MATKNIVPRADGEGGLGTAAKGWGGLFVTNTTTSSATEGGKLVLAADDGAVMGDDHRLGVIEFKAAEDGSNTLSIGARIQAIARDAWDGSNNDADLQFFTTDGTTESAVLTLDADKLATFGGSVSIDSVSISAVQTGLESFVDNDTSIMTSAAIQDKILAYGYTTATGDMTGVSITGGTNLTTASETNTTSGDYSVTLNVDDAFLKNDASDTTTGTITAGGFTTAGTLTLAEYTDDAAIGITKIQDSGTSFADNDTSIMTAGAIDNRIAAAGGGISHDGSTADGVLTYKDADEATVEANLTFDGSTLSVEADANTTASAINIDANSLTTGTAINVDVDDALTATAAKSLIKIDYDKAGVTASSQTSTTTGLNINLADGATNNASGAVIMTGAQIDVDSANAQGTITQKGLILNVAADGVGDAATTSGIEMEVMDGGNDIKMMSHADTADYCTIGVTTNGATTITTVDGGAAAANFEVAADGNITLDAAGNIVLETGTTSANYTEIPVRKFPTPNTNTAGTITGGDVVYFGNTTSMTTGAIYHYKSDGTWELADADAVATSDGLLAVALGAASDTNGMCLRGMVVLDHDPGAIGDVLFLSTTAGDCSATAPSGSADIVRVIGYQVNHASNGEIWFCPDGTYVELA